MVKSGLEANKIHFKIDDLFTKLKGAFLVTSYYTELFVMNMITINITINIYQYHNLAIG